MRYYRLVYDFNHDREAIMLNIDENSFEFDRYDVAKGKTIISWDGDITLTYDTEDGNIITDYLANNMAWFTITDRFRSLLAEYASESVQFLPIKVKPLREDIGLELCYLANILTVIDALDLEHSVYSYIGEEKDRRLAVRIYVLKGSRIPPDINIFRLGNSPFSIFISDRLRKAMRRNKMSGCQYRAERVDG